MAGRSFHTSASSSFQDPSPLQPGWVGLFPPGPERWLLGNPMGTMWGQQRLLPLLWVLPTPSNHPKGRHRDPFTRRGNSLREGRSLA